MSKNVRIQLAVLAGAAAAAAMGCGGVWAGRAAALTFPAAVQGLLRILPNVLSGMGLPLLFYTLWNWRLLNAPAPERYRAFLLCCLAGVTLILLWEFMQPLSNGQYAYTLNDLAGAFVGAGLAWVLFSVVNAQWPV